METVLPTISLVLVFWNKTNTATRISINFYQRLLADFQNCFQSWLAIIVLVILLIRILSVSPISGSPLSTTSRSQIHSSVCKHFKLSSKSQSAHDNNNCPWYSAHVHLLQFSGHCFAKGITTPFERGGLVSTDRTLSSMRGCSETQCNPSSELGSSSAYLYYLLACSLYL